MSVYMFICMLMSKDVCINAMCVCIYVYTRGNVYMSICVYMDKFIVYVYLYKYVCVYLVHVCYVCVNVLTFKYVLIPKLKLRCALYKFLCRCDV